ncbi:hypothetical protein GCM10017576_01180 [Microbacterium barkeri]|uniref:Uncharacterized protein n=1 Tax=Microbacterium barkeri TaxID=33917 RepID=A0A9W6H0U4_9MICO|nr:hypothetical protein GCM10017576_01180 [Microbacterium barkeri]
MVLSGVVLVGVAMASPDERSDSGKGCASDARGRMFPRAGEAVTDASPSRHAPRPAAMTVV